MSDIASSPAPAAPGTGTGRPELSVVVPVHNEAENLPLLVERLRTVLDEAVSSWQLVFVDDGSRDETLAVIRGLNAADPRISAVSFSRNFGKEIAIAAGLDHALGDAAIIMDADLQHPPETIPAFLAKWREGYLNVYGQRTDREDETRLKRNFAKMFYRIFGYFGETPLPEGAGDFRLLDRKVVEVIRALPERNRFMKGLFAWAGFKQVAVEYDRAEREVGSTKFNYWKLWTLALDGITSASTAPLRIWSYVGASIALFALGYSAFIVSRVLIFGISVPGYASIMVSVLFLGGVQLISLGVLGEYVGRILTETKQRPLYVVRDTVGVDAAR